MSKQVEHSVSNPVADALRRSRLTFMGVGLFSCAINLLMLTGPLFMLQVYDRVLASRSVPTLVALFGLVAALYAFLGLFDFIRSRALSRAGYRLDVELTPLAKKVWVFLGLAGARAASRPLGDLSSLRHFLCSNGLPALFDLPWVPLYLAVVYLLHPWLGLLATIGAIIVVIVTVINEWMVRKPLAEASSLELEEARFAERAHRNAESIISMGMITDVTNHWRAIRNHALLSAQQAGATSESTSAFVKAVRMLLQSGILALGAYLAILQEITAGAMIAASIIGGRALAPVDLAVGNWRNFTRARQAFSRLSSTLARELTEAAPIELPKPSGHLQVSNLVKHSFNAEGELGNRPILSGVHFSLKPGDGLGVIGPSASGKTTLARLLVGLWFPDKGSVRFDGATFDQWDREKIGRHIGYLPQQVELIAGTIRQNIARFDPEICDEEVVQAAKLAGVHDLILHLPGGYSTGLGGSGTVLSGGQVQRIALARAVLGRPPLVVLDEPNANLDAEGDAALTRAINALRKQGSCVVVMAHRPSAIAAVNLVLMLQAGQQLEFGPKEEVLRKVTRPGPKSSPVNEQDLQASP